MSTQSLHEQVGPGLGPRHLSILQLAARRLPLRPQVVCVNMPYLSEALSENDA